MNPEHPGETADAAVQPERERRDGPRPRIYVASLSDYNHGISHGQWLGADQPVEALREGIDEMLAESPLATRTGEPAEEWAIHDYDGFASLHINEYESLDRVSRIAHGIAEHGAAFAAWVEACDGSDEALESFTEHFIGHYHSRTAWGDQLAEDYDIERLLDAALPGFLRMFVRIDTDRAVRELELSGAVTVADSPEGGVYVFQH